MAITIQLDQATEKRLADEAAARGVTREAVAQEAVQSWLQIDEELDWEEDERRMNEPGENIPLDVAMERFRGAIAAERAGKK